MSDDYRKALETATREYDASIKERAAIDRRLAQLAQTIGSLSKLCGIEPMIQWGLTDSCRTVLQNAGRPMTPVEVRDRLEAIGADLSKYSNSLAAIHTVLKRLNQAGELRFIPQRRGEHAYLWNTPSTPVVLTREAVEAIWNARGEPQSSKSKKSTR